MPSLPTATSQAGMLSSYNLITTQGKRDASRIFSSPAGAVGALLTAISGDRITLGNDMFVVSVWQRLRRNVPADVDHPLCQ